MVKKSRVDNAGEENTKKVGKNGAGEIEIVLTTNLHCDGCCNKIRKSVRRFPGVRSVEFEGEFKVKIVAALGVDPSELRTRVEKKTNKHVEILSPLPKIDAKKDKPQKSDNDKPKEKEPPVISVVLKVAWHCDGCGDKIYKAVSSYKGVYEVSIDKENEMVMVKGKMEVDKMVEKLRDKLKKPVEIIRAEKKKDNMKPKDKKEDVGVKAVTTKAKGVGEKSPKVDQYVATWSNKDQHGYVYTPDYFSDENANGCSVM